ncbi:ATPase-like, ATP-binding domain protein [Metarhizium album ARSEF 1941]|uniref:ATPase-like, ATP-binding domain protein n=1 Tax=Metarhizium album (strain ARSEF 1941) TaxID=1081103 RepID=A0A0B2WV34_METAS|nr:ATPase-like, ATP-binding domain protein [Metarhizium album ARSEF 1941]KHN96745.1 ATPase-like, ATP-binding domain protein [Metarhizium album ARSEF 1941]
MLSSTKEEPSSAVTTVKLPHANVQPAASAMSGSTPPSMGSSVDMSAPALSPDLRIASPSLQLIQSIGAIELVEQDTRPTFLIDMLAPTTAPPNQPSLHILYGNTALRSSRDIAEIVGLEPAESMDIVNFQRFAAWATSLPSSRASHEPTSPFHVYGGINWTYATIRRRFRFISGNVSVGRPSTRASSPVPTSNDSIPVPTTTSTVSDFTPVTPQLGSVGPIGPPDYFGDAVPEDEPLMNTIQKKLGDAAVSLTHPDEFTNQVLQQVQPVTQSFDWTAIPLHGNLPDHIKFAKTRDWASTALGPMIDWAPGLRAMSSLVMATPHPAAMYWGQDMVIIYNEAYVSLAGKKHPDLMGMAYTEGWPEIWEEIEPVFENAWKSGQSTMKHDNRLFIKRDGFLEETFFSWAIVPLLGNDGEVVGLYNPCFENTRRTINERRMLTLREMGERVATATTVTGFWPQVQAGLEYNEFDVPFSIIYSVREEYESEVSSLHSGSLLPSSQLALEGAPGVPHGHVAAPPSIDLKSSDEGFAPYMRQCMAMGGAPVVLSEEGGNLPKHLLEGLQYRGFPAPCSTIVIFPVVPTTTTEAIAGFIVMGTNPRRPYDEDYKLFVDLLSRQLATSLASVLLFEEEIKRGQRAARLAALDRQELSLQLIQRTQEVNESEYRFTRMAEFAPVGMFIADALGSINYCNDMWWQISRHTRLQDAESGWMNSVRDEDRPALEAAWAKLVKEKVTISLEFRFKCSQQSGCNTIDTWVLMSAFPEKTLDGGLKSIFGCITDISSQKWAEKVQNERREEAVELKRQQENFIDITSHEMRNPLSAILQCADQIANNISAFTAQKDKDEVENLLEGCLDAANTINLCASHQKRIVDDILTLSKLDSNLLAVAPADVQPIKLVKSTLKMFEPELVAHDIEFEFNVGDSFARHDVTWAKLDPSRLNQVLINLMTNAIKFTQGRERRSITVNVSTSRDISEVTSTGISYFSRINNQRAPNMDITNKEEWGTGDVIHIHCSVEDTGPGLAEEEMKLLFQRFQQATPRTHVQYGGSGLGLFISRILAELQGGQIGVSSKAGVGSKFNFYIQCRKCVDPPAKHDRISPFKIGRKVIAAAAAAAAQSPPPHPPPRLPVPETAPKIKDRLPHRNSAALGNRSSFDVLIVEDNIVNQKVLQRQLRHCGNNTFVANHGFEALQTLQKSRFWAGQEQDGVDISVILMDLEMPVMDGMTCARKIRELEREGTIITHIPIIAVTAYARPEQIQSAKAAGIDDVISKPFRIPELLPKIEELVSRYKNLSLIGET